MKLNKDEFGYIPSVEDLDESKKRLWRQKRVFEKQLKDPNTSEAKKKILKNVLDDSLYKNLKP